MDTKEYRDRVCELECNIDDMTAEELAFAAARLMEDGARDVTITPVIMKKGRPASLLTVMCGAEEEEKHRFVSLIFKYTSTIGIREIISERYVLDRVSREVDTPYGTVRYKHVNGYGVDRYKIEYEDLASIAASEGVSIADARAIVTEYVEDDLSCFPFS